VIRFSSRTPGDYRPNRLNEALAARRAAGGTVLDLTLTNPTRAELSYPRQAILEALNDPRALTYDPTPRGLSEAREAVAAYHAGRGQLAQPDRLLLTGSTSEAYGWLFKLLCEPGDEVLAPRPSYPLFECLAVLDAVRIVDYPLPEELRWGLDLEALERCRTARTRAVVLVNPNNPTARISNATSGCGCSPGRRREASRSSPTKSFSTTPGRNAATAFRRSTPRARRWCSR